MRFARVVRSLLWLFPFISFIFGYFFTHAFFHTRRIVVPDLIGKNIQTALKKASSLGLNLRILREQEDADVLDGTVLEQLPQPYSGTKPKQYLFLTLSKRPLVVMAPNLLEQSVGSISGQCGKLGITQKFFWLQSKYPKDFCIAQVPHPGQKVSKKEIITYISHGRNQLIVFPDLKGCLLSDVKEFLKDENVVLEVVYSGREGGCSKVDPARIIDQQPMAGSIIDKSRKVYVQLQV